MGLQSSKSYGGYKYQNSTGSIDTYRGRDGYKLVVDSKANTALLSWLDFMPKIQIPTDDNSNVSNCLSVYSSFAKAPDKPLLLHLELSSISGSSFSVAAEYLAENGFIRDYSTFCRKEKDLRFDCYNNNVIIRQPDSSAVKLIIEDEKFVDFYEKCSANLISVIKFLQRMFGCLPSDTYFYVVNNAISLFNEYVILQLDSNEIIIDNQCSSDADGFDYEKFKKIFNDKANLRELRFKWQSSRTEPLDFEFV